MTGGTRKALYRVHAWLGLNLGLLAFVLCLSGTVAVFGPELTWLTDPGYRVAAPATATRPPLSWNRLHDAARQAYPDARIRLIAAPRGADWAARVAVQHGRRDLRLLLINPYTGAILGQRSGFNAQSFFRILHKQFYIVPAVHGLHGILIVGALGLVITLSVITGLLSLKRWTKALVRLRIGRGIRVLWSDLHRMTGMWSLIVALVLSLTGIWYLAEWGLHEAEVLSEDQPAARLAPAALRALPPAARPLDLDKLVDRAGEAFPDLSTSVIVLPRRKDDAVVLRGQADAWLVRDRANQIHLNPYSGDVLALRRATDLGLFERWVETADPLHFGTWGGLPARIAWLICGILMCIGILAGIFGAWTRRERANGMGRRTWLGVLAVAPSLAVLAAAVHGTLAFGWGIQARAQTASAGDVLPVPDLSAGLVLLIAAFVALSSGPAVLWVRLRLTAPS